MQHLIPAQVDNPMATQKTAPTLADIREARERLRGIAEETPIYLSETFSRRCRREVRLKAENLQRTGAFKIRGAVNRLAMLTPDERAAGVVAASAGNHGQAVAWAAREGYTIADGIAVKVPSQFTLPLLEDLLDDIVTVTDDEISEAIVLLLERAKLVVEGAGAVGVAALLAGKAGGTGTAIPILSGGNIDATMLISVMRHGLTAAGRYLVVRTQLADRPGELIKLLSLVAEERGNVISVEHHREGMDIPVSETEVELTLVTRDEEHCPRVP